MSTTTTSAALVAGAREWRSRFRFRPLLTRSFWPFWTGAALALVALQLPWTTLNSIGYSESCGRGAYLSSCPYGQEYGSIWHNPTSGGYGPGGLFLVALALVLVLVGWAAYRRELPRPTWFARLPSLAIGGLALIALVKLPGALLPLDSLVYDASRPYYDFSEPGWGVFVMLVALLPLWKGVGRVRRTFDVEPAALTAPSVSPAPAAR